MSMGLPSRARLILVALVAVGLAAGGAGAVADPLDPNPPDNENPCLDVDGAFDPGCVPGAAIGHNLRQACDYQFLPGCELTAFANPQYAVDADPSPEAPFDWKAGVVHEHSAYSDGAIDSLPRNYFNAARTGVTGNGAGVAVDFLFSSEHSDNSQITITTNADCLTSPQNAVTCAHLTENSFYWKWPATLKQAVESSDAGFTGIRGFEWTNDFFNHMNVFFSTNFRNVKIDGSYLSMQRMWDWLQRPVAEGGGADGLVTFNHPGGNPKLSPVDGGFPHTEVLAATGASNWNDLEYVPAVDKNVVGMEINGGEDIEYYIKALTKGWHIGAVAAEDHHGVNWSGKDMHKTLVLTKGRSPQDYYWAFKNRRTIAVHSELVGGEPGQPAQVPTMDFTADGTHVLGSIVDVAGPGEHTLRFAGSGLPVGSRVAVITSNDGQSAPIQLDVADGSGAVDATTSVSSDGSDWYFAVVCPAAGPDAPPCGSDQSYSAVTAPIWFR